jgi:EAL and modified HD-GYP domain-containing signal transduction protein
MNLIVTWQPIFNSEKDLLAYELYTYPALDEVYADALAFQSVLDKIHALSQTASKQPVNVFITCSADLAAKMAMDLFLGNQEKLPPKDMTIIQIAKFSDVTDIIITACKQLKEEGGYPLAAGAYTLKDQFTPLTELIDMVRFDLLDLSTHARNMNFLKLRAQGLKIFGYNLDTESAFQQARERDFSFYEGYFFISPEIVPREQVPQYKWNYLRLLQGLHSRDVDFSKIEEIIKKDEDLAQRLLEYINSASFALKTEIESIRHALNLLGVQPMKKWATLLAIAKIGADLPRESLITCLMRAKFLDSLGTLLGNEELRDDLFLLGMFSMIDAFFGRERREILSGITLVEDVHSALLENQGPYHPLLEMIQACETGDWETEEKIRTDLGLDLGDINRIYWDSLSWAQEFLGYS